MRTNATKRLDASGLVLLALGAWLVPGGGHLWLGRRRKGIVFLVALKRNQPADLPETAAWVQMPEVTAASLQVTTQDQAIGLMTAATRQSHTARPQTQASFETARQAFAQGMAQRMPATFRRIDDPREVAAFTQLLAEQIDA